MEDFFFCNRRSTWRCKTLPPGMVVIIGIMKQGNEVAIPPEARNLQGGSSHDWSLQIKPFKTRGLLSLSKEIQRERERQLTIVYDWISMFYVFTYRFYLYHKYLRSWQIIEKTTLFAACQLHLWWAIGELPHIRFCNYLSAIIDKRL